MRVVGGVCKGRRLAAFRGGHIRPTSDKVREAVFNIICNRITLENAGPVLDLFAGTGAMGIEAMSRGACEAVFVDMDAGAAAVINKNLEICGLRETSSIFRTDVKDALRSLAKRGDRFALIFIDPPYNASLTEDTLKDIEREGILTPGGLIVVETSKRKTLNPEGVGFKLLDERMYGDTAVYFFGA